MNLRSNSPAFDYVMQNEGGGAVDGGVLLAIVHTSAAAVAAAPGQHLVIGTRSRLYVDISLGSAIWFAKRVQYTALIIVEYGRD